MSLEELAAGVVLLGLVAYAIFGGADFGAGVWTARRRELASGPQREALFEAMGHVWETNHVWLILIIVTLFTAFPSAFADLFTALLIRLVIALIGIVFRGSVLLCAISRLKAALACPPRVSSSRWPALPHR